MALASKGLRASAIVHLFASINLSRTKDFAVWRDMVAREPKLAAIIVREVSFDRFFNRERAGKPRKEQQPPRFTDPASLPLMPNVRLVTWCTELLIDQTRMALSCLSLFPNLTELRLSAAFDHFNSLARVLAPCRQLKALHLVENRVNRGGRMSHPHSGPTFDLTSLETLEVQCQNPADYIIDLITHSPPRALKSLTIGNPAAQFPCSHAVINQLFKLAAPSLVDLEVEPSFHEREFSSASLITH